jgi:hypothetical protein
MEFPRAVIARMCLPVVACGRVRCGGKRRANDVFVIVIIIVIVIVVFVVFVVVVVVVFCESYDEAASPTDDSHLFCYGGHITRLSRQVRLLSYLLFSGLWFCRFVPNVQ